MSFYKEGLVPEKYRPNWDYWEKVPFATIEDLASLAVDFDPRKDAGLGIGNQEKELHDVESDISASEFNNLSYKEVKLLEKKDQELEIIIKQKEKTIIDIRERKITIISLMHLHIENRTLSGFFDDYGNVTEITLFNFVEWLKETKIPYPDKLNKVFKLSDVVSEKKELTKGQKSSLTQENTVLKRMFKELVKLHYGDNATGYAIAKDLTADAQTIKKHLDSPK